MIKKYTKYFEAFYNGRTERERYLILFISFFLIGSYWYSSFYQPLIEQANNISSEIKESRAKITNYQSQVLRLTAEEKSLSTDKIVEQTDKITKRLKVLDKEIGSASNAISSPDKAIDLLHDLLNDSIGISLQSIKNSLPEKDEDLTKLIGEDLYRHSVTLEIDGSFDNILNFIKVFEVKQPSVPIFALKISRLEYPLLKAEITYHLFSHRKEILSV